MTPSTLSLIAALLLGGSVARAEQVNEYALKSGFIFNFIQFTEWTEEKLPVTASVQLCVAGQGGVAESLHALRGHVVRGHAIEVRRVTLADDLASCHVVFVPALEADRTTQVLARHAGRGLLVVGERSEVSISPSVIDLTVVNKRVTFSVDLNVARTQGVVLSSKLLSLASHVRGAPARQDR